MGLSRERLSGSRAGRGPQLFYKQPNLGSTPSRLTRGQATVRAKPRGAAEGHLAPILYILRDDGLVVLRGLINHLCQVRFLDRVLTDDAEEEEVTGMHPSIEAMLQTFEFKELSPERKKEIEEVRKMFLAIATTIAENVEGPEATVALRKLRESKDCTIVGMIYGSGPKDDDADAGDSGSDEDSDSVSQKRD